MANNTVDEKRCKKAERADKANSKKHAAGGRYSDQKNPVLRLLQKMMTPEHAIDGVRYHFGYNSIVMVLIYIKKIFMGEKALVKVNPPVVVVGDLHGQFFDLERIFASYGTKESPGWANKKYLFLGDYVDRGRQSLEVIMTLYCLKILYPANFSLLRGNHETKAINRVYGLKVELEERFSKEEASNLWAMINESFSFLPLSALVGQKILCMHGGISPALKALSDIEQLPMPLPDPNAHQLACDLLWADPMYGLEGFATNEVRGVSVYFGEQKLASTMELLGVELVVRAHQCLQNGHGFFANRRLVTLFSASNYNLGKRNSAAVMEVDAKGKCGFKTFEPVLNVAEYKELRALANEHDTGHVIAPAAKNPPTLKACVGVLSSSPSSKDASMVRDEPVGHDKPPPNAILDTCDAVKNLTVPVSASPSQNRTEVKMGAKAGCDQVGKPESRLAFATEETRGAKGATKEGFKLSKEEKQKSSKDNKKETERKGSKSKSDKEKASKPREEKGGAKEGLKGTENKKNEVK